MHITRFIPGYLGKDNKNEPPVRVNEANASASSAEKTPSSLPAGARQSTNRPRMFQRADERKLRKDQESAAVRALLGAADGLRAISSTEARAAAMADIEGGRAPTRISDLRRMTTALQALGPTLSTHYEPVLERNPELRSICDEAKRLLEAEIGPGDDGRKLCSLGDSRGYNERFSLADSIKIRSLLIEVERLSIRLSAEIKHLIEQNPTWPFLAAQGDRKRQGEKKALDGKKAWSAIVSAARHGSLQQLRSEVKRQMGKKFSRAGEHASKTKLSPAGRAPLAVAGSRESAGSIPENLESGTGTDEWARWAEDTEQELDASISRQNRKNDGAAEREQAPPTVNAGLISDPGARASETRLRPPEPRPPEQKLVGESPES